jgi:hypothetical protein
MLAPQEDTVNPVRPSPIRFGFVRLRSNHAWIKRSPSGREGSLDASTSKIDERGPRRLLSKKSARIRVIRGCTLLLRYFHFLLLPDRREANRLGQQDGLDATQRCEHLVVDLAVHLNDRNG